MKTKIKRKVDKIDTIKSLLLKRIEHHECALSNLREQLRCVEGVEAMLPALVPEGINLNDPIPGKPYSHLTLTEALKLAILHAGPTPKKLRDLRNMLAHGGYPIPEKGRFSSALNATLYRLETQGLITSSEDEDGLKTYMRKI